MCCNKSSHKEKGKKMKRFLWRWRGRAHVTVKEGKQGRGPGQVECCESQVEQLTPPRRWLNTYTHVTEIPPPEKQNKTQTICMRHAQRLRRLGASYRRKYGQLPSLNTTCEHNTCSLLTLSHTRVYINTAGWLPRWEHTLGDRNNRPLQSVRTAETQWHHTKRRDSSLSPSLIQGRGSNGSPPARERQSQEREKG